MTLFEDLPPEIIPIVVENVTKPQHLAAICLVSRAFHAFTVPVLYKRIFIYPWQREGKLKVGKLFRTLASVPQLARYVSRLEVREFPKALAAEDYAALLASCLAGLAHCVNLHACTWTRDGALSSEILAALQQLPKLRSLTINGHHSSYYDPVLLMGFTRLAEVSIIMPDPDVLAMLFRWIVQCGNALRSLTLICKASNLVTDDYLQSLAPFLPCLEHLHLAGCPRVTHAGITSLLAQNPEGIVGLGLEGLSPTFDMLAFDDFSRRTNALTRLESLSVTTPTNFASGLKVWCSKVAALVAPAPLRRFQVYSGAEAHIQTLPDSFCAGIAYTHRATLTRFSVHRISVSLEAIELVCRFCTQLEQLFVAIEKRALHRLGESLAPARRLHTVHVNFASDITADDEPGDKHWQLTAELILRQGGPTIRQFGCNTRVWQVDRVVAKNEAGEVVMEPRLGPFEHPDVPEQFLVVRT